MVKGLLDQLAATIMSAVNTAGQPEVTMEHPVTGDVIFEGRKGLDPVKFTGGYALGGLTDVPVKWLSWLVDGLFWESSNREIGSPNNTWAIDQGADKIVVDWGSKDSDYGLKYAERWQDRKLVNVTQQLPTVFWSIGNFLWFRFVTIKLGRRLHAEPNFWLGWTILTASVPKLFNYYWMRSTGAWTYTNEPTPAWLRTLNAGADFVTSWIQ